MTSRGASPLSATSSSPGCRPARSAGEPGDTATTLGDDMEAGVGARPGTVVSDGCGEGAAGPPPGLLRRRRDGHQGPGLDGPGVRTARLLLPRDRPQPAGGGTVPHP